MLEAYRQHVAERATQGIPPLPLTAKQTADLIELLKNPPKGEEATLVNLMVHRVPAGVDDAAKVKASYLAAVALGKEKCAFDQPRESDRTAPPRCSVATTSSRWFNLLDDALVGGIAPACRRRCWCSTPFHDVKEKADKGNANAKKVLKPGPMLNG